MTKLFLYILATDQRNFIAADPRKGYNSRIKISEIKLRSHKIKKVGNKATF